MAHAVYSRDLGRNQSWRKATVRSLSQALLDRERITTTLAKAKEAQRLTERLISLGKDGTLHARRRAVSILGDPRLVARLFDEIAPRFSKRNGGFTRITHSGFRPGDAARMAVIELVERAKKEERPAPPKRVQPPQERRPEKPVPPRDKPEPEKTPKKKKPGFIDGIRKLFGRGDQPS